MNNTVLRILSAVLALGALAVGLFAIKLSQGPSAPSPEQVSAPASAPTIAVATSLRALKAGQTILASDIAVKGVQSPPMDAFTDIPEIVGRMVAMDIPAGAPLTPGQFASDSIAYLLKSGERAVGIQVDEVSSVGGFLKPGEHVDVLAYVPPPGMQEKRLGAATIVIQDARLLTIGDVSKVDQDNADKKPDSVGASLSKESGLKITAEIQELRLHLRSAVLAVKEADVNRLMTASTVGQIRLALRPPAAFDANAQLGQGQDKTKNMPGPASTWEMTIKRPKDEDDKKPPQTIIIQEGSQERSQGERNKYSIF